MATRLELEDVKEMLEKNPCLKYTVMGGKPLGAESDEDTEVKTKKRIQASNEGKTHESKTVKKTSKYRNKHVYIYADGYISQDKGESKTHGEITEDFDSQKEFARWQQLQMLERAGAISSLRRQVEYIIQDGFVYKDEKIRKIAYNADFQYIQDGKTVVEDVKGVDRKTKAPVCTKDFKLKWKLLKFRYPEVIFRIF